MGWHLRLSDILTRSGDIRNQSLKLYKIEGILHVLFWHQFFLLRAPSEFLDLHYKIQPVSDHVAKFHVDRPW